MNQELLATLLAASGATPNTATQKNKNFAEYVITDSNDQFMAFVNVKRDAVPALEKVFSKLKVNLSPRDENHQAAPVAYAV